MRRIFYGLIGALACLVVLNACANKEPEAYVAPETGELAVATFAGGCFWCVEAGLEVVPGVQEVVSGYTGGHVVNPTYRQVSGGGTGHVEAVQVYYDPGVVTYEQLLDAFWRQIDPTDRKGQFSDRGSEYRPVIFVETEAQRTAVEKSRQALDESGRYRKPVVIEILPSTTFYIAEANHQDYYKRNPLRYRYYRSGSGRDRFLKKVWGSKQ